MKDELTAKQAARMSRLIGATEGATEQEVEPVARTVCTKDGFVEVMVHAPVRMRTIVVDGQIERVRIDSLASDAPPEQSPAPLRTRRALLHPSR